LQSTAQIKQRNRTGQQKDTNRDSAYQALNEQRIRGPVTEQATEINTD
jgi:hypothetical protein